jgi:hypothetical protein
MWQHSPRAFPWEIEPPVGNHHGKEKRRPKARARRPRERTCVNKKCGRKYHARRWNQRYCQGPECRREVNRWLAARRQAERRKADAARAQHAQAEKVRRQRGQVRAQGCSETGTYAGAWSRSKTFFARPLCDRPGCYEPPVISSRNPARFCCAACRQAVRNVLDRERKWRWRGTLDGRMKRSIEYRDARRARSRRQGGTTADVPPRALQE